MAKKTKRSAAIGFGCSVAAVIFFIIVIAFFAYMAGDESSYESNVIDTDMQFDSMDVTVDWNDDRSCLIKQEYTVRFFKMKHGIFVDIPVNSGEMVRDLNIVTQPDRPYKLQHESMNKIVRAVVGDPDIEFHSGDSFKVTVTYKYITPKHKNGGDILALMAIGKGWSSPVKSATVTMTYPTAPENAGSDYGVWIAGSKIDSDASVVQWSNDGKTVTVTAPQNRYAQGMNGSYALGEFEGIEIAYKMPDGTMHGYVNTEFLVTVIIGVVLLVAALLLEFLAAKNKPLTPIVDFYPPRVKLPDGQVGHMTPVVMGKIIDDSCSSEDVTSLIFYWASKGFLEIDDRDDGTYLTKLKDIEYCKQYERRMFDSLFERGKEDDEGRITVSLNSLSGKFASNITSVKTAVNSSYKDKFYKKGFTVLARLMTVLCGIFGVAVAVLSPLRIGLWMLNLAGFLTLIPVVLSAVIGSLLAKQFFKLDIKKRKIFLVGYSVLAIMLSFAVALSVPFDVMMWPERIVFALCLGIASAMAPFLLVRTDYYNEQLNAILGFRDFLRDAEKDRLETLLADDPQYYYNILPYANVLGVSDIWEDKFKNITLEPPTYYRSYRGSVFSYLVIRSISHDIGSKLTYTPPKVSAGSFSGGSFGGGGGGGGFSGGSFGGGGGGSW